MGKQLCVNCGIELDNDFKCPKCGRIYSKMSSFNSNPFGDNPFGNSSFGAIPLEDASTTFSNNDQHMFNQDTANIDQDKWNEWMNQNIHTNGGQHSPFGNNPNSNPSQPEKKRISGYTVAAVVLLCFIIVQLIILFMINRNKLKLTSSTISPAHASIETQYLAEEELCKWVL